MDVMSRLVQGARTVIGISLIVLSLMVEPSAAAVVLDLDPPAATPGTTVVAVTVDESMTLIPSGRLQLLLAPSQAADKVTRLDDLRLAPIGVLVADKECFGHLSFTVPQRRAGNYVVVAHCAECRPNMTSGDSCSPEPELAEEATGRGTMFTVGDFEVSAPPVLPRTGISALTSIEGALVLSLLGTVLLTIAARRRSSERSAETN